MAMPAAQTAAQQSKRMRLDAIVKGKQSHPLRVLLAGTEGVGKTSFAAAAPKPIFLAAEDGTQHLDVARFPVAQTYADLIDAIHAAHDSDFESFVIDTLDFAEPMVWAETVRRYNAKGPKEKISHIEDLGYGKGPLLTVDVWRELLLELERLQAKTRMHVILLAHTAVKTFKNPEGPDFDRYEITLNKHAMGLIKAWTGVNLFANYRVLAKTDTQTKRAKGINDDSRIIFTQRAAAFDAKNRYDLPPELPLSWEDFFAAVKAHKPADPVALLAAIEERLAQVPAEKLATVKAAIASAGQNPAALAQVLGRINATIQTA